MEENVDEAKRVVVFRLYSEGASGRNMEEPQITVEENVDEAQRIEVFRLYSKDFSRRNIFTTVFYLQQYSILFIIYNYLI